MADKILRYSAEAVIIFLLLRYFPRKDNRLTTYQSLIGTFILLILSIIIEQLFARYLVKNDEPKAETNLMEKFDSSIDCISCRQPNTESVKEESINVSQDTNISQYTPNDQIWKTTYGIDGMLYDDDEDKTNMLPMASDYEHSYSFLSTESS